MEAAQALGLTVDASFTSLFLGPKGCYAYSWGPLMGYAYFGLYGTLAQMSQGLTGNTYRVSCGDDFGPSPPSPPLPPPSPRWPSTDVWTLTNIELTGGKFTKSGGASYGYDATAISTQPVTSFTYTILSGGGSIRQVRSIVLCLTSEASAADFDENCDDGLMVKIDAKK